MNTFLYLCFTVGICMQKREFKDKAYTVLAKLIKAMANPHRLEIIDLLGQSERSVEEIATETGLSFANASQHLQILRQSHLVEIKRRGNFILYRLANDSIYKIMEGPSGNRNGKPGRSGKNCERFQGTKE